MSENVYALTGRDLDCEVAQKVYGFREMQGPTHDYHGPCESLLILVPTDVTDRDAFSMMRPTGAIPREYFVPRYSTERQRAFEVLEHYRRIGFLWDLKDNPDGVCFQNGDGQDLHYRCACQFYWRGFMMQPPKKADMPSSVYGLGDTIEQAICRAGITLARLIKDSRK